MTKSKNSYSNREEIINVITHGLGAILSVVALFFLIEKAMDMGTSIAMFSMLVYGISMIILYTASTLYHGSTNPKYRNPLNVWDHISIYLLIAGSYTPFTLLALPPVWGYTIFTIVWIFAFVGITIKLFFFGKYRILSAIAYVIMGWIAVTAVSPLIDSLTLTGSLWLFGGGISYTFGAVLYLFDDKIPYNHAIFHVLVLIGSGCHFISVYYYV
jgi:hemolysin III